MAAAERLSGAPGRKTLGWPGLAATIIGTVIGAGFATGQEILQFFAKFGRPGLWGIIAATMLFCALFVWIMGVARSRGTLTYAGLFRHFLGQQAGVLVDGVMTIFLLGMIGVMFAGAGAAFQALGLPGGWGIVLTMIISILAVLAGIRGVVAVNGIVVPAMILFSMSICFLSIRGSRLFIPAQPLTTPHGWWGLSALLFVSYNFCLSLPVLTPLGSVSRPATIWGGGLGAGVMLGVMITGIYLALGIHGRECIGCEVPLLHIAAKYGWPVQMMYGVVLWGEIMTTAVGNLFGVSQRIADGLRWPYPVAVFAATVLSLVISRAGFARLVGHLYPLFGYVCLGLLLVLLLTRRGEPRKIFVSGRRRQRVV